MSQAGQGVADTEKSFRIHTFILTVFFLALLVVGLLRYVSSRTWDTTRRERELIYKFSGQGMEDVMCMSRQINSLWILGGGFVSIHVVPRCQVVGIVGPILFPQDAFAEFRRSPVAADHNQVGDIQDAFFIRRGGFCDFRDRTHGQYNSTGNVMGRGRGTTITFLCLAHGLPSQYDRECDKINRPENAGFIQNIMRGKKSPPPSPFRILLTVLSSPFSLSREEPLSCPTLYSDR